MWILGLLQFLESLDFSSDNNNVVVESFLESWGSHGEVEGDDVLTRFVLAAGVGKMKEGESETISNLGWSNGVE